MSRAETYVNNIIGSVESNIGSLSAEASAIITRAANALDDAVTFPQPGVFVLQTSNYNPTYAQTPEVPGLPEIPPSEPPEPPTYNTGGIAPPPGYGSTKPTEPGKFSYPILVPAPTVSDPPALNIDDSWFNIVDNLPPPQLPNMIPGFTLDILPITIQLNQALQLNLPPIDFVDVDVNFPELDTRSGLDQFKSFIFGGAGGVPGIDELKQKATIFSDKVFGTLSGALNSEINSRLTSPYAVVNATKEVQLASLYEIKKQIIEQQQVSDISSITQRTGWILPQAIQASIHQQADQLRNSWFEHSNLQRRTQQIEQANKMFEFCTEAFQKTIEAVENFRSKEVEMVLSAHRDAIQYARKTIQVLSKAFDVENYRKYDFELKKADGLLKKFEAQFQLNVTQYEFIKAKIDNEKMKQEFDGGLVKQYGIEAESLKAKIEIVSQQIDLIKTDIKIKEFPIKKFKAKIDAFNAKVNSEEAVLRKMLAQIEGNSMLVDIELSKIKVYETEVKAFEDIASILMNKTDATIDTNRAMMTAYDGTAKAASLPVDYSLLNAQRTLYIHQINADNFIQDSELAIKVKEMDMEFMKQTLEMRNDLMQTFKELSLDIAESEIDRKKAIAEVSIQCANVVASMAEGAMSAGNLVASTVLNEFS